MTEIEPGPTSGNVPKGRSRVELAARLAGVRSQINAVISAPGCFGGGVAQRRRRDVDILSAIAADLSARMLEARER